MLATARNTHVARRRRVTLGCIAAAALLHAVLGWMLLRAAVPKATHAGTQQVLTVRWLRAGAQPAPPAPAARERAPLPRSDTARARAPRPTRRAAAAPAPPAVAPAAAPAPIDGRVFALPRIGYGDATHARGLRAFAPPPAAQGAPHFDAQATLRRQIADHIQRQLAALPAPPADGRCALNVVVEPHLMCDSESLNAALAEHATPLARLMAAHQRDLPGAEPVAIEARAGQFRLLLP